MTVVTKPLTAAEKKKEAEANSSPLVQVELEDEQQPQQAVDEPDLHLAYLSMAGRVRRLSRANHMCLALCLTIVTMLGLMAGMHVYRTIFIRRNFCGTYRIPLNHGIMPENTLVAANFQNPSEQDDAFKLNMFALFNHELPRLEEDVEKKIKDFEFDFELDMDSNEFESFELPEIFLGRYMHDFKVNYTVIIDTLGRKCFLMSLDRNIIPAPKNVFDILAKMRDGAFDIDYEEIRKTYRIAGPAITQFDSTHGSFIPDACSSKPTYRLEELVGNVVVKRDAGTQGSGDKFGEFVGSKLIKYNIINMEGDN